MDISGLEEIGTSAAAILAATTAVSALLWKVYMRAQVEDLVEKRADEMGKVVEAKFKEIRDETSKLKEDTDKKLLLSHTDMKERIEEVRTDQKYIRDKVDQIIAMFLQQARSNT